MFDIVIGSAVLLLLGLGLLILVIKTQNTDD